MLEGAGILWFGQQPQTDGLRSGQTASTGEDETLLVTYRVYPDAGADRLPADTPVPVAIVGDLDDHVIPSNGEPVWHGIVIPGG